jgi:TetR/AcrR family transcriptional repressor of nem operon
MARPSKRADILRIGGDVRHRRGYGGTSVESITEAAGVPKGSFFNHFGSKEQFGAEALDAYFARWEEQVAQILASAPGPASQVKALMRAASGGAGVEGPFDGCMVGNFSLEIATQGPAVRDQLQRIFARWAEPFRTVIAAGQASGIFGTTLSADRLARFIVNSLQGAILRAKVDQSELALRECEELVAVLLAT